MAVKTAEAVSTVNITNNADALAAFEALVAAKAAIKAAEQIKKDAEAVLRDAAGTAQTIILRGVKVATISDPRVRKSNDAKVLAEAFPEAYQATLRETFYTVLNVL